MSSLGLKGTTLIPALGFFQSFPRARKILRIGSGRPAVISPVAQLCPIPCDPMDCSLPGFPVHHQLPEFAQTHVHRVGDAIQPSHPLLPPSPHASNFSQHQGLFSGVSCFHQVAKLIINFPPVIIKLLGFISNEDSAKNIPYKLAVDDGFFWWWFY